MLLKNIGDGKKFVDVALAVGAGDIRDARGAAIADFDHDGDFDIVVNNNPGVKSEIAPMLLRNDIGTQRNWLEVELRGTVVNRDAAGSEVRLELPNGRKLMRHVMVGSSYASQRSLTLDFGLGDAQLISKLTVTWKGPGGGTDVFENIAANQILRIVQGAAGTAATLTPLPTGSVEKAGASEASSAPRPTSPAPERSPAASKGSYQALPP